MPIRGPRWPLDAQCYRLAPFVILGVPIRCSTLKNPRVRRAQPRTAGDLSLDTLVRRLRLAGFGLDSSVPSERVRRRAIRRSWPPVRSGTYMDWRFGRRLRAGVASSRSPAVLACDEYVVVPMRAAPASAPGFVASGSFPSTANR